MTGGLEAPQRYTVAVDFDGVLHSYASPWIAPHVIPDPPVDGAIEWLYKTIQRFDIVVMSTRGRTWRGRRAMRLWVKYHAEALWRPALGRRGLEELRFTNRKIAALVYLDDRAIRFTGPDSFPQASEIHRARPWNRVKRESASSDSLGLFRGQIPRLKEEREALEREATAPV